MSRLLSSLSGPAVKERLTSSSVIVIPIGAVEHHGPHLPLGTDAIMAHDIGIAATERAVEDGIDAWTAPTVSYGKSDEHRWAPGTMTLDAPTLLQTLGSLGDSVASTPANTLVFVNGHGGNVPTLALAARDIRIRTGLVVTVSPALWVAPTANGEAANEDGYSVHGGAAETSIMRWLRPDDVDMSRAPRVVPNGLDDLDLIGFNGFPVSFGWVSNDFDAAGIIGDATRASVEWGKTLFEYSVQQTARAIVQSAELAARGILHSPSIPQRSEI